MLRHEGDDSLPPEPLDSIASYEWDIGDDGTVDLRGPRVSFDTSEDGVFVGRLTAVDSFGLRDDELF